MLQFFLAAAQFALGDLLCPTTPSAKLTPEVRAQEKLGWRLALEPGADGTLTGAIESARRLKLAYVGGTGAQHLSPENPKPFGPDLTDTELSEVRIKMELAGVRLLSYRMEKMPDDQAARRNLFEFGRKMGIETFISQQNQTDLDELENHCRQYGIAFVLQTRPDKQAEPKTVLDLCGARSKEIGVGLNLSQWLGHGTNPSKMLRALQNRLLVVALDRDNFNRAQFEKFLSETHRLRLTPTFLVSEQEPSPGATIDLFNASCLKLK